MITILLRLLYTFTWGGYFYITTETLDKFKDSFNTHKTKVSRNIVSFLHSVLCTFLSYLTIYHSINPTILYYFSLSYFLWIQV